MSDPDPTPEESAPNTLLNGIVGGGVALLLFFLPFSPVLGGGVAGYLEGGTTNDGAKVGAIAGVVALVPALFVVAVGLVFVVVPVGTPGPRRTRWVDRGRRRPADTSRRRDRTPPPHPGRVDRGVHRRARRPRRGHRRVPRPRARPVATG